MGLVSFTSARDRLLAAESSDLTGTKVCAELASAIETVAPFDAAAVMITDPGTHLPAGGVVSGFDPTACAPFWDNELLDPDFNKFNDLMHRNEPVATLVEATDGELARSPRFGKLYADYGAVDELRVVFVSGSLCLGIGAFLRCEGEPFSPTEVNDVRNLLVPASNALRRALGRQLDSGPGQPPVVLLLGDDGTLLSATPGADDVLADLRVGSIERSGVPGTVMTAVSRCRSSRDGMISTLLRGTSGRWVRVHVSRLEGEVDATSVTIDSAHASDLVPILLDSYGLTEREIDIVLALCRGLATKEIAAELAISPHTVRDHLKLVFVKAGVNSRGELVASLFSDHLLHSFEAAVTRR